MEAFGPVRKVHLIRILAKEGFAMGRASTVRGWSIVAGVLALAVCAPPVRAPDCNDNGIEDADDIASGASEDVNGNRIPDECEGTVTEGSIVAWGRNALGQCNVPALMLRGSTSILCNSPTKLGHLQLHFEEASWYDFHHPCGRRDHEIHHFSKRGRAHGSHIEHLRLLYSCGHTGSGGERPRRIVVLRVRFPAV